jgi:hypothetical protein
MNQKPQPVPTESKTVTTPWGPQASKLEFGYNEAQRLYNDKSTPSWYGFQTYASPSADTLGSLDAISARANAGSPLLGQAQSEVGKTLSGAYLDPATAPGYQSVVDRTKAAVIPSISANFANAGGAGGLAARAAAMGLGDAIGSLNYQHYGAERNRMGQAASMAPELAQADYLDPMMLGQAGATRDQLAQQPINEQIAKHDFEQNREQAKLADFMQMIQGSYGGTSNTTGTQFLPPQNPLGTIFGGLLGGLGTAASLGWKPFSDERLKEDIKRVGETDEGLPIYTYKYKWGGPPMMGVMAQDVARVKPEAVSVQPLGGTPYLAVDYAQVS